MRHIYIFILSRCCVSCAHKSLHDEIDDQEGNQCSLECIHFYKYGYYLKFQKSKRIFDLAKP